MNDRGGDQTTPEGAQHSPGRGTDHRTAFLEFGSTSIKFYLVATAGEEAGQVQDEIKIPWELGYDVFQHARISPSTVARCTSALRDLQSQFPEIAFDSVTAASGSVAGAGADADRCTGEAKPWHAGPVTAWPMRLSARGARIG